jgi:tetratricopeptide (TPR) repeat protein
MASIFFVVFGLMKSSDAYKVAVAKAKASPSVVEALGTPIEEGLFATGSISVSGPSGDADLAIPISGPNGKAIIYATATKSAGEWTFSTLIVQLEKSGARINLLEQQAAAPDHLLERGAQALEQNDYDLAIDCLSLAIRLDPNLAVAYHNRAFAYFEKGEFDKAIADCNEAIRVDPNLALAYNNRGNAYRIKGEFDKAIADYSEAIRLDPNLVAAYGNRGFAYDAKGEFDKAIADYSEAIRLNPKLAPARNALAWLLATCPDAKHRDGDKAVWNAAEACRLTQWGVPEYLDTLAAARAEVGDFAEAVKWEMKAIELCPPDFDKTRFQSRLELYRAAKPWREQRQTDEPRRDG